MALTARDRIAKILRGDPRTASSVGITKPRTALSLHVDGFGDVPLPVSQPKARMLTDLARPVTDGCDPEVPEDQASRRAWEIPRPLVRAEWNADALRDMLDTIKDELGFPSTSELTAELRSMLIYGGGQVPDRQEEPRDPHGDVAGTLIVTLPSTHRGGDVLVEDDGEWTPYEEPAQRWASRSSAGHGVPLLAVACRSGCRPEIREVTSGYRITLAYDLRLTGAGASPGGDEGKLAELASLLREHFDPPPPIFSSGREEQSPTLLAFLLDGEHTPDELTWDKLTDADTGRVSLLREAATRAGCETVLAFTDIQEIHDVRELRGPLYEYKGDGEYRTYCEDPDDYYEPRGMYDGETGEYLGPCGEHNYPDRYGEDSYSYSSYDPYDPYDPDSAPRPRPGHVSLYPYKGLWFQVRDLEHSATSLTHWTGQASGAMEETARSLPASHVCAVTPSADLAPYESRLRGPKTLERRYRRAAVLVWPRELAFANRAEAGPSWALEEITAKANSGEVASAREMARSLAVFWEAGPFRKSEWFEVLGTDWPGDLLSGTLAAAGAVAEPEIAAMLLRPFSITDLRNADAPLLAAAAGRYGQEWAAGVLRRWLGEDGGRPLDKQTRQAWTTLQLPGLCAALHSADGTGAGTCVARQLLGLAWAELIADIAKSLEWSGKNHTAFSRLGESIAAVLAAAAAAGATDTRDAVARHLREQGDSVAALEVFTVRAGAAAAGGAACEQDGFRDLAVDCAKRLRSWLAPA